MMKLIQTMSLSGLGVSFGVIPALRRDWVFLDSSNAPQSWQITGDDLGLKIDKPFSVRLRILHGGRQEGVGHHRCRYRRHDDFRRPTRGMNVLSGNCHCCRKHLPIPCNL